MDAVQDRFDVEGLPIMAVARWSWSRPARGQGTRPRWRRPAGRGADRGKTSLTELRWLASGGDPWLGTPPNRWTPASARRHLSGSAVAVGPGKGRGPGTDTGGSCGSRRPAAGSRPEDDLGRVPLDGEYPLAPSMDTVAPLGVDVAAVELGMRPIDPGFTVPPPGRPPGRTDPAGA